MSTTPTPSALRPATLVLVTAALALAGCELRRDDEPQEPTQQAPAQEPSDASPGAADTDTISIIREEIVPVEPVAPPDLPPEPLQTTLPFPDGSDLSAQTRLLLNEALESDAMQEGWPVIVAGHTDSSGNDQANLRASRARAEAVAAWLVERGVADERIEVIAFGEQNPAEPNALPDGTPNEEGRRLNRRVELLIAPPPALPAPLAPAAPGQPAERAPEAATGQAPGNGA